MTKYDEILHKFVTLLHSPIMSIVIGIALVLVSLLTAENALNLARIEVFLFSGWTYKLGESVDWHSLAQTIRIRLFVYSFLNGMEHSC
jgi:uncharacterized protein YybS (DUF2232 family)